MPPKKKKLGAEFHAVLDDHRARLDRLVDRRAAPRVKALYDRAYQEVAAKLRHRLKTGLRDTYTVHQHHVVLAQLQQGQVQLAHKMKGELGDISKEAQTDAIRGLVKDLGRLENHFTGAQVQLPVDQAAKLHQLTVVRRPQMDKMHQQTISRWGGRTFNAIHENLTLSLLEGETALEAIDRITEVADLEWWQGERIVRTETAWAFNSAHYDAFTEASEELDDLEMRWTELVNDDSGEPLDSRVGVDSLALHGQVVEPGGVFVVPDMSPVPDAKGRFEVPEGLAGVEKDFPPNRPNDRAVLSPWRPHWGVPGYRWDGGRVEI